MMRIQADQDAEPDPQHLLFENVCFQYLETLLCPVQESVGRCAERAHLRQR